LVDDVVSVQTTRLTFLAGANVSRRPVGRGAASVAFIQGVPQKVTRVRGISAVLDWP
jgi:hypothetical protein